MSKRFISTLLLASLWLGIAMGQDEAREETKEDLTQVWPAKWIISQKGPWKEFAVHRFRRSFQMEEVPGELVVHTSGDNRYRLYVNGTLVTWGPQRGDLDHWFYESTDIAPYLKSGKNLIAAEVLNYGSHPPDPQLSVQSAFLLAADVKSYRYLNTGKSWKAAYDSSYSALLVDRSQLKGYYGGGSRERVDGRFFRWEWQKAEYNDDSWDAAQPIENAFAKTCIWASRWKLTPRTIPMEIMEPQRFREIRKAEGIELPPGLKKGAPIQIPPRTSAKLIFDQGIETTAYPVLEVSRGEGSQITLRYAEAPVKEVDGLRLKGNRNVIEGKVFRGYADQYISDGGSGRVYTPFWWRAFRYVEMTIQTGEEELILEDFHSLYSGYPFETKARLELEGLPAGKADTLARIMEVGDRTVRLCAHETFMDCPYYEESQFPGDTRIEALVSYTNFGDARLGKNAIEQFSWSITDEGFLSARYPTNSTYYIPNYNLYWIGMLHDYMMYVGDEAFIRSKIPVMRTLLDYFIRREREDGTIERPDYHNFVDWTHPRGEAPFDEQGYSAIVDLHVLMAFQWAAELESYAGDASYVRRYQSLANRLSKSIRDLYWDTGRGLFTDTPRGDRLSVHTNHLAILTGLASEEESRAILHQLDGGVDGMVGASIYWQFYRFQAMDASGEGVLSHNRLDPWKEMLRAGVTTWPETGPEGRSECHGWGASPNYFLLSMVAGIKPSSPAFKSIRIEPRPGEAVKLSCSHPHPMGKIDINLEFRSSMLKGTIIIPAGTSGILVWNGKDYPLLGGKNNFLSILNEVYEYED